MSILIYFYKDWIELIGGGVKLVFKKAGEVFKKNIGVILALFLMMYVPVIPDTGMLWLIKS